MAAYAAVISLKHTIKRLLKSYPEIIEFAYNENASPQQYQEQLMYLANKLKDVAETHELNQQKLQEDDEEVEEPEMAPVILFTLATNDPQNSASSSSSSSSREILKSAYEEASSLQQVMERLNDSNRSRSIMERVDALEAQIRDCANKLEDVLEFHELKQQLEEEEEEEDEGVMRQEINSFGETAKRLEKEYIQELSEDDDGDDAAGGSSLDIDFGVEMIGRSRLFDTILQFHVLRRMRPDDRYVYAFLGEKGSGSKVIVKTVFKDARQAQKFECFGWARVGANYKLKLVLMSLIAQVVDKGDRNVVDDEVLLTDEQVADGGDITMADTDEVLLTDEQVVDGGDITMADTDEVLLTDEQVVDGGDITIVDTDEVLLTEQVVDGGDITTVDTDEGLLTNDERDVLEMLANVSEGELSLFLYKALENRRYMIVLDDVDDVALMHYLTRTSFPDQSNGSVVLLTTKSREVTLHAGLWYNCEVPNIYDTDFWLAIREALFGREYSIPAELEAAGKKILHACGHRQISVAKTLVFLSKSDKTVEQWSKIAADEENLISTVVDEISEISEITKEMQYCKREVVQQASIWIDFSSQVEDAKKWMHPERFFSRMQIISFSGMAGIGKTTFARKIFKDDSTLRLFDHHVWILLGPGYQTEEILIDILAQIYPNIDKLNTGGDEKLVKDLCAQVSCKRCLIVLDDLCSKEPLLHLKYLFPDIKGTILVTTKLPKVAKFEKDDTQIEMNLLDEEESWCLFCQKVFDQGLCPPKLEKAGRKIAEKCDGLPLLILIVADQLRKVEQSEEYWNSVALGQEKSVFKNAHHQISEALLPSYHNLPQHLKPYFLYIGIFREKYEISTPDLTNLWISEGFLEPNLSQKHEDFVADCLSELVDRSLVMAQRKVSGITISTCRLHSVFWHLSNIQAVKNKYFHAMNGYDDCSIENMDSQRRLCIRNNILLGIKDVHMSMASNTSAHSLLCVGPLHQYPVPLKFDLRLLRVMNALTIRLYEFPIEVTSLFHLRYFSITCNGELPTSISKLLKLQYLIVNRYMDIKSSKNSSYLPLEIWDMKELKHLQVVGGCLPDHKSGTGLLKLSTLLDVSAQSCREEVLTWIPNVKRLGIRIELAPIDEGNSFHCLNSIHHLQRLESLKYEVVNPQFRYEAVAPPAPFSMFSQNLKKLSLSGLGYPWEQMSIISKLENLEVLKLKSYAFQGPKWEMYYPNQFGKLKFLLLEDTDLVSWKLYWGVKLKVEHVCIKHCYKLREMPLAFYTPDHLKKIQIVDCSPVLVTWAQEMKRLMPTCEVDIHRSWLPNNQQK